MSSPSDRVLGTPPTNTSASTSKSSRRGFLVQATAAAAGGAALGAGLPLPASPAATAHSEASVDPILAAIEAHRRAAAAHDETVNLEMALEESLPDDQRQSCGETVLETDDPRWLVALRAVSAAWNTMDDQAINLLRTEPRTIAGIKALLRYFADQEGENLFPDEVRNDDGSAETFGSCLVRHAADALRKIARPNGQTAQQHEVQS
jgi:hypothetical protein